MRVRSISSSTLIATLVGALLLVACGGGSSPPPPPPPAPDPGPPPPPSAPSIAASRVVLSRLGGQCGQTQSFRGSCFGYVQAFVAADGRYTVFWNENEAGGSVQRYAGASGTVGAPQSTGSLMAGVAPEGESWVQALSLGGQRFAYFASFDLGLSLPARGVLADFSVNPTAATGMALPPMGSYLEVLQDGVGRLYSERVSTSAIDLGGGVLLQPARTPISPLIDTRGRVRAMYPSSAPRLANVEIGRESSGAPLHVYITDIAIDTGAALATPRRVSTAPLTEPPNRPGPPLGCNALSVHPVSSDAAVLAWHAVNAAQTGCDLLVENERITTRTVCCGPGYVIAARSADVVVAWDEYDLGPAGSIGPLRWRKLDRQTGQWTAPALVAPDLTRPGDDQRMATLRAAAPAGVSSGGAMVFLWRRTAPTEATFLSKYAGGSWTTVAAPPGVLLAMAINDAGRAVVVYGDRNCGAGTCEELAQYSF